MVQPPKLGGQGHLRGVKAGNWHQYETPHLLISEHRGTFSCKMGYYGMKRRKQNPPSTGGTMCVSDPGSICGLQKLLDLGAEKRMFNVIIPSWVNCKLQEWVPRAIIMLLCQLGVHCLPTKIAYA